MDSDWVCTSEDFPQIGRGYKNISADVICKCDNGEAVKGFYAYHTHQWYNENGKRIRADVIAWQTI